MISLMSSSYQSMSGPIYQVSNLFSYLSSCLHDGTQGIVVLNVASLARRMPYPKCNALNEA